MSRSHYRVTIGPDEIQALARMARDVANVLEMISCQFSPGRPPCPPRPASLDSIADADPGDIRLDTSDDEEEDPGVN